MLTTARYLSLSGNLGVVIDMPESAAIRIEDICTPALIIDLPSMEWNISTMATIASQRGISLRPYVKTHKSTVLAHRQLEAGATGIGCATIDEAEVMAAAGIRDILIGNQIVGAVNIARLIELTRHVDIMVAVDDYGNVDRNPDSVLLHFGSGIWGA